MMRARNRADMPHDPALWQAWLSQKVPPDVVEAGVTIEAVSRGSCILIFNVPIEVWTMLLAFVEELGHEYKPLLDGASFGRSRDSQLLLETRARQINHRRRSIAAAGLALIPSERDDEDEDEDESNNEEDESDDSDGRF